MFKDFDSRRIEAKWELPSKLYHLQLPSTIRAGKVGPFLSCRVVIIGDIFGEEWVSKTLNEKLRCQGSDVLPVKSSKETSANFPKRAGSC